MMRLSIQKKPGYSAHFIRWLMGVIQRLYLMSISPRKLRTYSEYIDQNICPMNSAILFKILIKAISGMRVVEHQFHYSIESNPRLKYRGIPLDVFVSCVEYGGLGVRGNYLLTKVFNMVERNESRYYKKYMLMYY